MTKADCEALHTLDAAKNLATAPDGNGQPLPAATWHPYGWTRAECLSPASMKCCLRLHGSGSHAWCEQWSQDDQAGCAACGGKWTSAFQFSSRNQWVQGRWAKGSEWAPREEVQRNRWVTEINMQMMVNLFQESSLLIGAEVVSEFVLCRGGPSVESIQSVASQEQMEMPLGTASAFPGQPAVKTTKEYTLEFTATSLNAGGDKVPVDMTEEGTTSVMVGAQAETQRLRRLQGTEEPRRTQQAGLNSQASCFAVVYPSRTATTVNGQLAGPCLKLEFTQA